MSSESNGRWVLLALVLVGCRGASASDGAPGGGDSPGDAGSAGDAGAAGEVEPPPGASPIEPVWRPTQVAARIKSPGPEMRFTAGLPFRILADGNDLKTYECPPGHPPYVCPDSSMTFYVDGEAVGTVPPDPENQNLWELRLPRGLPAGEHVLTVRFQPHRDPAVDGLVPVRIHVDPVPSRARTIELASDLVLSGTTDLDWSDAVVRGNGHKVRAAPGYAGKITIRDSLVTGLAAFDHQLGIDVTTTGAVDISGSVFEATAPLRLAVNGSAPIRITGNEFRSTNYVTYVSSDPHRSPILDLSGTTYGAKVMQGNNIGAGIVRITAMRGWQIGGLRDSQANILLGPRCVLDLVDSSDAVIQGNYLRHDYYGGFSQGFNLMQRGTSDGALAEHNVIRDSSWPVQSFGGELRYNLLINSGHDFLRSTRSRARIHHNVFAHAQAPNSQYDGAIFLYGSEQDVVFDHNTIDVGGVVAAYDAPAIVLGSPGVSLASLRNNAFTQFSEVRTWSRPALVAGGRSEASASAPRIAKADYNAWFNPLAAGTARYLPGLAAGSPGRHDVDGDPRFAEAVPQSPYRIDEGAVWRRTFGVSKVLAHYRALYTPRAGSPLIDAGDPADGAGNDIGAIGAGAAHPADQFGRVMTAD